MTSARQDEASAKMGDLLLRGWTMLAAVCNGCGTPLMEDRRLGTRVCVLCGTDGADADAPDEEVPADAAARTEELGRPQQRGTVQAAERDVSELLAEKMLAGWALLGQACPMCGTTLVRNKQQASRWQCARAQDAPGIRRRSI